LLFLTEFYTSKKKNKMYKDITTKYKDLNIMSSLVLREFLYQL
jgi:hypothetical protein